MTLDLLPRSTEAVRVPSASAPALIEARGVTVELDGRLVLDHIDITVLPHEIVTLIGLNGSGKTTLARALLGLIRPSSGTIVRKPGLRVGYVPQMLARDFALPISVRRFVGLSGRYRRAEIDQVLENLHIAHLANAQFAALSGGELRRVMLARALIRKPELLVLDEPMSGVDVSGQAEFYRLIGTLRQRLGCAVLLVSHDLYLVMAETDQVICLNHHVCCAGRPHAVVRDPSFVALFGREVAEALAVYRHAHDHVHGPAGEIVEGTTHPGIPAILAILSTKSPAMDDFLVRGFLAGAAVALIAGPLGSFIVWRRMAYFGAAVSHSALLGVALGLVGGIDPMIGVIAFCVASAWLLIGLERQSGLPMDTLIGLVSHVALAGGLVLLAALSTIRVDLMGYLFGDVLAVDANALVLIAVTAALSLALLIGLWRPLLALTVNEELAAAEGVPVRVLHVVLMTLTALVVAIGMKIVGMLLIVSLLILPPAAARPLSGSPEAMALLAIVVGVASVGGGLAASFAYDLQAGPMIVLAAGAFFLLSLLARALPSFRPARSR